STQDGLNPYCTILDELHAHEDRDLFDVMKSARGARRNPLSLYITTAGYNVQGVCFEQHKLVKKILEGVVVLDNYFGIIFTIDDDDDPFDPAVWIKANPNYGVSVNPVEFQNYANEAKVNPEALYEFKTKRLNVWTSAKNGHINMTEWNKNTAEVDLDAMKKLPCWGAFDLASVSDLTAFRLVWRGDDGRVFTWGKRYLPEAAIVGRTERAGLPYRSWVDAGLITATPGSVADYSFMEKDILEAMARFNPKAIAFDDWNSTDLVRRLMEKDVPVIKFIQGIKSYNPAIKFLDRLYLSHQLAYGNDPVLRWNASNLVTRKDANDNFAPDKQDSMEKIDDIVCLCMGLGLMLADQGEQQSVYETRGGISFTI
ncbi:MAG: terminase large subunit, partial [Bdellovibrionales bacterium]